MNGGTFFQRKLKTWAQKKKDESFILETNTEMSISYGEFYHAVAAFRRLIESEETSHKTILIAIPGGIVCSVVWMAGLTGGHLLVPVSPMLTDYEFDEIVGRHKPDIVISDRTDLKIKGNIRLMSVSQCLTAIQGQTADAKSSPFPSKPLEGSVFLSSSGSTGQPKGMILTAGKIVLTAKHIGKSHRITSRDLGLTPLPFYHVNAPVVSLATAVVTGSSLVIAPKFSASNFWNWIEKFDPSWVSVVPAIVAILLKTDLPRSFKRGRLRFMRSASAPLPVVYLTRFEQKFDVPLIETYGLSEAASTVASNPVPPGKHKAGSVGLPIGVTVRICKVDRDKNILRDVPAATVGEICIRGDNVISSYEENVSKDSFCDGWFRTGDMGYIDREGYIFITGRIKDIIIRGGENIDPREIEEVLLADKNVSEAAVVGQPDPIYGEKVAAFVVLNTGNLRKDHESERIKQFAGKKLSTSKVPKDVYILDELPKGKTGKISKKSLKTYPNVSKDEVCTQITNFKNTAG